VDQRNVPLNAQLSGTRLLTAASWTNTLGQISGPPPSRSHPKRRLPSQ
jgi:hypothetical protein